MSTRTDKDVEDEIESLALEGTNSGDPIEVRAGYWEEKHRRLDARLEQTANQ